MAEIDRKFGARLGRSPYRSSVRPGDIPVGQQPLPNPLPEYVPVADRKTRPSWMPPEPIQRVEEPRQYKDD